MTDSIAKINPKTILEKISSLLLYRSIFDNEIGRAFIELLQTLYLAEIQQKKEKNIAIFNIYKSYGNWFQKIAESDRSWQDYLVKEILENENTFSQKIQKKELKIVRKSLIDAAKQDLKTLQNIYKCCDSIAIAELVENVTKKSLKIVPWDIENSEPELFLHRAKKWHEELEQLAKYYRQKGTGIYAKYQAFTWQKGELQGIDRPDPIEIATIAGYESQKQALIQNTEFLLAGLPALHVLLYGSRGSGKSSLVKSLLQKYSDRGLRLIEVSKLELHDLPQIVTKLREIPQKFIIFVDDLSFEEDDDRFKSLKVVLEGSVTAKPNNMVVYATSNRRHLVREYFGDRPSPKDGDEVHSWDTMQEKLSFSDRFGLTITFTPPDLPTYLEIVIHLARREKIQLETETLITRAKQWAIHHNGRSGRSARQFIDFLNGELALKS